MAFSNSAVSYNNLGTCFENQGDYMLAIQHYEEALAIWQQLFGEKHAKVALVYNNLGLCYSNMGDLRKALSFHEKSLKIRLFLFNDTHISTITSFANIGITHRKAGDYQKAIQYYQKAIHIGTNGFGKKHPRMAILYNNLGNCYQDSGQYKEALIWYNQSLFLKELILGQKHFKVVSTLINLGDCHHKLQNYEEAIRFHQRALSICQLRFEKEHPYTLTVFFYLGKDHFALDKITESQKYHEKALEGRLSLLGLHHPDTALSYLELSKIFQTNNQDFQALDLLRQSLNCLFLGKEDRAIDRCISSILLIDVLIQKANLHFSIYEKLKSEKVGKSHLQYALICYIYIKKIVDYLSKKYQTKNSRLLLAEKAITIFEKGIDRVFIAKSKIPFRFIYCSSENRTDDNFFAILFPKKRIIDAIESFHQLIFLLSEASKSLLLLSNLQDSKAKLQAAIPQALQQKEYNLKVELNYLDKQIKKETAKGEQKNESLLQKWQNQYFNHSQEYEQLILQFEQNYPEYYRLKYDIETVGIETLQQSISKEQLMISYFIGEKYIYIFGITKNGFEVLQQEKPTNFNQLIKDFNKGLNRTLLQKYAQAAHQLYQILLAPVLQFFDSQMSPNRGGVGEFSPHSY